MATPLEALQNRSKLLSGDLSNSSTAYAPNTLPSKKDVSSTTQLASVNQQIEDLKSKQLRAQWYGPNVTTPPAEGSGTSDGLIVGGLKALSRPLNAIAGTAQYVLGKGTKNSLVGNINESMKTGLTFGNVLQQEGLPWGASAPLGFALDVMFDPVNWATAGTAALIPRVGMGLIKGGAKEAGIKGAIEAAKTGLTSGLEKKASTALNLIPFAKRSEKFANLATNIGEKAVAGAEKYDSLVGKDVYDKLNKGILGMPSGIIGNTAEEMIRKIPSTTIMGKATPSGEAIADFMKYSPATHAKITDLKDKVENLAKDKGAILTRSADGAQFQTIDDFLKPGAAITIPDKTGEVMEVAIRDADGVLKPEFVNKVKVADNLENAQALLEAAGDDYNLKHLTDAYKTTSPGQTGVKWYDNAIERLKSTTVDDIIHRRLGDGNVEELVQKEADDLARNWNSISDIKGNLTGAIDDLKNINVRDLRPLEKILNAHRELTSIFKAAKVPMNLGSHVVANLGNLFMGAMAGLPVWKPEYLNAVRKGSSLVKGKLGAAGLKETFFNDLNSWVDLIDKNPNKFRQFTGMDPSEILGKISAEQKVMGVLGTTKEEVKKFLVDAWDNIDSGTLEADQFDSLQKAAAKAAEFESSVASKIEKEALKKGMGSYKTPSETLAQMVKDAPIRQSEMPSTWAASELTPNKKVEIFKNWLEEEAKKRPNNPIARLANTMVNSMPKWYEHIDQSWKIGSVDYMTRVGLTEQELITTSRFVPLTKEDILAPVIKGGEKLYTLTPQKASEVAMETYMNYAAMPDFVKVMRALPIAGSPFISFPYAMLAKSGKTAINNPAVFNKIGFIMNEFSGARSPEEKVALEEKYNQYLKSPTVVKMFGMWNTDVKNFIPYYTMNMFNPSEKTYDDSVQGQILKMSDKFPILQDPLGSVIKDYFIQPWILSGSGQAPQGQFGQPLYPSYDANGKLIDASLRTKAFYGARTLAESVVPGSLSYLGIVPGLANASPEAINLIPSYGARSIANAAQGRSSIGAMTKEDSVRKTLRSILGRTGIPAYTLDTTKTTSAKK